VSRGALAHLVVGQHGQPSLPHGAGLRLAAEHDQLADLAAVGVGVRAVPFFGLAKARERRFVVSRAALEVRQVDERGQLVGIDRERALVGLARALVVVALGEEHAEIAPGGGIPVVEPDRAAQRALGVFTAARAGIDESQRAPDLGIARGLARELLQHAHRARGVAELAQHQRVLGRGPAVVRVAPQLLAERPCRRLVLPLPGEQLAGAEVGPAQRGVHARGLGVRHDRGRVGALPIEGEPAGKRLARLLARRGKRRVLRRDVRRGAGRRDERRGSGLGRGAVRARRGLRRLGGGGGGGDRRGVRGERGGEKDGGGLERHAHEPDDTTIALAPVRPGVAKRGMRHCVMPRLRVLPRHSRA
jgi:hypothetical protein